MVEAALEKNETMDRGPCIGADRTAAGRGQAAARGRHDRDAGLRYPAVSTDFSCNATTATRNAVETPQEPNAYV
jgi:hypothetical protein